MCLILYLMMFWFLYSFFNYFLMKREHRASMILGKSGITELESKNNINKFGSKENKRIFINNIGFKKFTTQIGQMQ